MPEVFLQIDDLVYQDSIHVTRLQFFCKIQPGNLQIAYIPPGICLAVKMLFDGQIAWAI